MQQFPICFAYDHIDGAMSLGTASTEADAIAIYNECADTPASSAELTEVEVGGFRTFEAARDWAYDQIGAGTPQKVWNGYVVFVETWNVQ